MKNITKIFLLLMISLPVFSSGAIANTDSLANLSETATKIQAIIIPEKKQEAKAPATTEKAQPSTEIEELRANADALKDNQNTNANKLITAGSIAATGIGAGQLLGGTAEKKADERAERDMEAYLSTFQCDYGTGTKIMGGEKDVVLPGGNELISHYQTYVNLAGQLKQTKNSLGLSPGIESEVIFSSAETGLYDNASSGKPNSTFTSLSRAMSDPTGEDAKEWQAQKDATSKKITTGTIVAGAGLALGIVGNLIANKNAPKNRADEINEKYAAALKKVEEKINALPVENPPACPDNATGTYPDCICLDSNKAYNDNPEQNECVACEDGQIARSNECVDNTNTVPDEIIDTDGDDNTLNINKPTKEPALQPEPAVAQETPLTNLEKINIRADGMFKTSSYTITDSAKAILNEQLLEKLPTNGIDGDFCILIEGHTDRSGSDAYNQSLSENRARAVSEHLTKNIKVDADNINFRGFGENHCMKPIYDAQTQKAANKDYCNPPDSGKTDCIPATDNTWNKFCRRVTIGIVSGKCTDINKENWDLSTLPDVSNIINLSK